MSKIERLALIRHGESLGNAAETADYHGSMDSWEAEDWALSENGWEQGRLTGQWLRDLDIAKSSEEIIWCSEMLRAKQTVIAMGMKAIMATKTNIHERPTGDLSWQEMKRQILNASPDTCKEVVFGDFGGKVEPLGKTIERVRPMLEAAEQVDTQGSLALVSHGHIIMAARIILETLSEDQVVDILRNPNGGNRIHNGDILLYSRSNTSRSFTRKQHFSPTRNTIFDPVSINGGLGVGQ